MKRRGFSLLEIMVVVALIGVLSTLLIVGVSKMQTSGRRQQTHLMLQNCQAMFAEYDVATRQRYPNLPYPSPGAVDSASETAYESMNAGQQGDRNGFYANLTRSMFSLIRAVPTARAAMDKLPADQLYVYKPPVEIYPAFNSITAYSPTNTDASKTRCSVTPDANTAATNFIAIAPSTGVAPPNAAYWLAVTNDITVPIVLDGWGNPIFFFFGGGLGNQALLGSDGKPTVGSGALLAGGRSANVRSPDNRPFFASAGPDGNFALGDDNLYSFDPR